MNKKQKIEQEQKDNDWLWLFEAVADNLFTFMPVSEKANLALLAKGELPELLKLARTCMVMNSEFLVLHAHGIARALPLPQMTRVVGLTACIKLLCITEEIQPAYGQPSMHPEPTYADILQLAPGLTIGVHQPWKRPWQNELPPSWISREDHHFLVIAHSFYHLTGGWHACIVPSDTMLVAYNLEGNAEDGEWALPNGPTKVMCIYTGDYKCHPDVFASLPSTTVDLTVYLNTQSLRRGLLNALGHLDAVERFKYGVLCPGDVGTFADAVETMGATLWEVEVIMQDEETFTQLLCIILELDWVNRTITTFSIICTVPINPLLVAALYASAGDHFPACTAGGSFAITVPE